MRETRTLKNAEIRRLISNRLDELTKRLMAERRERGEKFGDDYSQCFRDLISKSAKARRLLNAYESLSATRRE